MSKRVQKCSPRPLIFFSDIKAKKLEDEGYSWQPTADIMIWIVTVQLQEKSVA